MKKRNLTNYEFDTRDKSVIPHIDVYVIDSENRIFIGYILNGAFLASDQKQHKVDRGDLSAMYNIAYKLPMNKMLRFED